MTERFLFGVYELLAASEFFDADYYRAACPDVAQLNMDPLTHYLEYGCREKRNPSIRFDTEYYLSQCQRVGEVPANALLHYLTVGARRGLLPSAAQDIQLHIDVPHLPATALEARGGLSIVGWSHSQAGIAAVDILVDEARVLTARLGLPRTDVAKAFPGLVGAERSGFLAHIPPKAIAAGKHALKVVARDGTGSAKSIEFHVEIRESRDEGGPWQLCTHVPHARSTLELACLKQMHWEPVFTLVVACPAGPAGGKELRRTLDSLACQVYPHWRLRLVTTKRPNAALSVMLSGFRSDYPPLADRITCVPPSRMPDAGRSANASCEPAENLFMFMAAGDQLGADALLEWALASARDRDAELIYSDERCPNPLGMNDAFFKPDWSPSLLQATNYLGRAWCVRESLLLRAGLNADVIAGAGTHETVLTLSKQARSIGHVAKVLYQTAHKHSRVTARSAPRFSGKVSIIIPMERQADFIRDCIGSLRRLTRRAGLEIICVASVADLKGGLRQWLDANVDTLIGVREPFHWAKFCNRAAAMASGRYLLFLDDGIEVQASGWLDAMLRHLQSPEVGAVGSILRASDGSIAESGRILDEDGRLVKGFRGLIDGDDGYFGLASIPRNVTAVGSNILMTARQPFLQLGSFDVGLARELSAADYCLRLRQRGLESVITPVPTLLHRKPEQAPPSASDRERFTSKWLETLGLGDRYVNPNLMREQPTFVIEREPFETVHAGTPLFDPDSIRRILIIKLDHIGDSMTALPAVRRIQHHFLQATLTVLCASASAPLWAAERTVSEVMEFNLYRSRSELGKNEIETEEFQALIRSLHVKKFDLAIDLRKQPDSRHVLESCGARYRAGFDHQGHFPWLDVALEWDEDVPLRGKHGHVALDLITLVDRVALAGAAPEMEVNGVSTFPKLSRRLLQKLSEKSFVCVHPASGSRMRQWPPESFSRLIDLLAQGKRFNIALLGNPEDSDLIAGILAKSRSASAVINLTGSLSLSDIPGLLSRAILFVGNNSGPQHIAASLGIPTIGIHSGVVDASEWGPRGIRSVAVRRQMSCSPCFLERPEDCQRNLACLTGITVAEVYRVCQTLLPAEPEAGA